MSQNTHLKGNLNAPIARANPTLGLFKGMTILCMAAQRARPEMISLLLQLGADPFDGDVAGR